jgi:ActR/RegA family two-component response regulator
MRVRGRTPPVTYTALVVDADRRALAEMTAVLADAGYLVSQAASFADARQRLVLSRPDVLVTAVRLGGFNGLHLVVSTHAALPDTVAIVTHAVHDPALQADAAKYDAMYLVRPVDWTVFLDVVRGLLAARGDRRRSSRPRRWTRKQPADPVGGTLGVTPATVVDLSYGGVRLRLNVRVSGAPDDRQMLALPSAGVAVRARPVWVLGAGPDGPWWCGVEVEAPDPAADRAWRAFVDRVRPPGN